MAINLLKSFGFGKSNISFNGQSVEKLSSRKWKNICDDLHCKALKGLYKDDRFLLTVVSDSKSVAVIKGIEFNTSELESKIAVCYVVHPGIKIRFTHTNKTYILDDVLLFDKSLYDADNYMVVHEDEVLDTLAEKGYKRLLFKFKEC